MVRRGFFAGMVHHKAARCITAMGCAAPVTFLVIPVLQGAWARLCLLGGIAPRRMAGVCEGPEAQQARGKLWQW